MGAAAMAVWHAIPTDWLYAVVGWFAAQWTYSWREHEKRRADERTRRTALVAELDWTRWAIAGFMIAIARGQPNVQPRILPILRWADAEQRRRGFQPLGFAELDDAQLVEKVAKLKPHGLSEARSLPTPVLDAVAVQPPFGWSTERIERLLWLRDKVRLLNEEAERLNRWFQMTFDVQGPLHQRVTENYQIQRSAYIKNLEPTFNAIRDVVADLSSAAQVEGRLRREPLAQPGPDPR